MALGRRGTGLLIYDREDFVVAELHLDVDRLEDMDAPLEAQLFSLCSSRERIAAGGGEWEVKHARARGGKAKFGDLLCWWEASMDIPYGRYLCWVDYSRGVISVMLITLPLTSSTSPCQWITFLLAILTHSAEDGRSCPGLCALPRMER